MGNIDETLSVELDKFMFATHQIIDEGVNYDEVRKVRRYQLEVYILGEGLKKYSRHIEYPDGWWQAFKSSLYARIWLPFWFLRKFPVRNKVFNLDIDVVALYPELSARISLPEESHNLILRKFEWEEVCQQPYATV